MLDIKPDFTDLAHRLQHQRALARAQSKGGAALQGELTGSAPEAEEPDGPPLVDAELMQLHVRVIALESLVIAMLAKGSDRQLAFVRAMADYISPRPGFTPHHLTIGAAKEMISLVKRAGRFRRGPQPRGRRREG